MNEASLTPLEAAILNRIQQDFPLCADPYAEIARGVGCSADAAYTMVCALRQRGIIRRLGGSFVAGKLGYVTTLVAARVEEALLETVAAQVNRFAEVTHNYQRAGEYNLWFTIIAEHAERVAALLAEIRAYPGVQVLSDLPAERIFKIHVDFHLAEGAYAEPIG
jgi:DNA-binding Lrp family transcriptional regulator